MQFIQCIPAVRQGCLLVFTTGYSTVWKAALPSHQTRTRTHLERVGNCWLGTIPSSWLVSIVSSSRFPLCLSVPSPYLIPEGLFSHTKDHFWPCLCTVVSRRSHNQFILFSPIMASINLLLIAFCFLDLLHVPRLEFSWKFGNWQVLKLPFETSACLWFSFFF